MEVVSVIMPTYDAQKWVVDTIDGLMRQTYPHVELIVVDDASRDDTVAVVREKLTKDFVNKWQIVELDGNRGPSAARNVGLRAARGSWVQFLDSDDFMAPQKFERQMAYCASAPSDVSAIYSPWRRCYFDDGKITWDGPIAQPEMEGKAPIMCLVGANRPLQASGLARRSALEQIGGFDEALRFWECEEINVRLAKAGRLEHVASDEPLYLWRDHRDKVYIGGEDARYQSTPVALGWIEQVLKAAGGRSLDQLNLAAADRRDILEDCTAWARKLYSQDRAGFRKYLALARKLDPNLAPTHPKYAAALSRYAGYEFAEAVARLGRMHGTLARRILRKLTRRPIYSESDGN
jgi:glycosyltransferase involved in cell wall biosynthesis